MTRENLAVSIDAGELAHDAARTAPVQAATLLPDYVAALDHDEASCDARVSPVLGELASQFTAATQKQTGYFQELTDRIDRLEQDLDPAPLRDALVEICQTFGSFTTRTETGAARVDSRMAALAGTMELLARNITSARDESQRVRLTVHQEMMGFTELVQSVEARMEQIEKTIAGLADKGTEAAARTQTIVGHLETLTGKLGTLTDTVESVTGNVGALTGKLETLTGNFEDLKGEAGTLSADMTSLRGKLDMAQEEKGQLSKRLQDAETGIASAKEKEQALAQMYSRLAEAFSPAAARA